MKKILIVDDEQYIKKLLTVVLRGDDRQLLCADSGEEGIAVARAEHPDVILLDVMMPGGMDGYQATKILKSDPSTKDSIVIVMTAKVQEEDRQMGFDAGADGYLSKPFEIQELQKKIASLVN